ncbi:MAG: DUF1684 domain-containing protein [Natrialbaceae archaeon]|nr:DUF1684 domain-containing protein [Natrialbaceae archaeon]
MTDYVHAIEEARDEKDEYFQTNPHSPIDPERRDSFEGLEHDPVDTAYRFEVALEPPAEQQRVTVGTSTGGEQEYVVAGTFTVTIQEQPVPIQAYQPPESEDRLWVPFRDATSGEETYGAGRYLDLERSHHRTEDGSWILDFNRAYNPTCAYSDHYECPLPPTENWLGVPIEAGEKLPP